MLNEVKKNMLRMNKKIKTPQLRITKYKKRLIRNCRTKKYNITKKSLKRYNSRLEVPMKESMTLKKKSEEEKKKVRENNEQSFRNP